MTSLNVSAIQMKAVSILSKHSDMKAVSKMLTSGIKFEKTDIDNVFNVIIKDGNEKAVLIDDRFLVISYNKPKKAKEQSLYLNKSVSIEALETDNVVVIDFENKTVENGLHMKGFSLSDGSVSAIAYMTGVEIIAVRNYLNHTQVYFVKLDDGFVVASNIKEARKLVNSKIVFMKLAVISDDGQVQDISTTAFCSDDISAESFNEELAVVA